MSRPNAIDKISEIV